MVTSRVRVLVIPTPHGTLATFQDETGWAVRFCASGEATPLAVTVEQLGAGEARGAHNPEVARSKLAVAMFFLLCDQSLPIIPSNSSWV